MFHGKILTFETVNFGDLIWFRLNSLKSALEDFTLAVEGRNATGTSESDRIFKGFYMFLENLKQNTLHFVSFFFIWPDSDRSKNFQRSTWHVCFRSETKETEGFWAPTSVSLLGLHHEAPRRLVGMGWHSMGPESPWRVLKIFYAEGNSWKWWRVKELQKNQPLVKWVK